MKPSILLLLAFASLGPAQTGRSPELTLDQRREVFNQAWGLVNATFYDPGFNGVSWEGVKTKFAPRFDAVRTAGDVSDLVREMLATLRASHIGLLTREEFSYTQNGLPFFFERVGSRVFVSYVFQPKDGSAVPLRMGDEIVSVDNIEARFLRLPSVTHVDPVWTNPYYGPAMSAAHVRIRRAGRELMVGVQRRSRFDDVRTMSATGVDGGIRYVRFLKLNSQTISLEELAAVLKTAISADGIIVDLRNCVGGDGAINSMLSGVLLGPDKALYAEVRRRSTARDMILSGKTDLRFTRPVAVLVNGNTESEPEIFTAVMKEYKRVRVFGSTTRGAFNGYTEGSALPYGAGIIAIPVTRTVTAMGNEYEGRGVVPDEAVAGTERDFAEGRDAVLEAALAYLRERRR